MIDLIRAVRLPFITASILPFIFGSIIAKKNFNFLYFLLGLVTVLATHLSANLINDYADAQSGVDYKDRNFYGFFGGSKLIQENILPKEFYFNLAIAFLALSALCVLILAFFLKSPLIIAYYCIILLLAWSYSAEPLQFSYHRWGEVIIFLLFGPALVMGGYFIQTGLFPDGKSFILSMPFGFLVTAILFANEVPDFAEDYSTEKFNWVSLTGQSRAFILYFILIFLGLTTIILNVVLGNLSLFALGSIIFLFPAVKAARILKKHYKDKVKLIISSKLTIAIQTFVSLTLILDLLICKK